MKNVQKQKVQIFCCEKGIQIQSFLCLDKTMTSQTPNYKINGCDSRNMVKNEKRLVTTVTSYLRRKF